jgi:hypothetical protein
MTTTLNKMDIIRNITISSKPRKVHSQPYYTCDRKITSNSKFAPKQLLVFVLPTLDECIGFLPKDLGNHILSFTNVWLEFYLENLIRKYGNKFFIVFICDNAVLSKYYFSKSDMRDSRKMIMRVLNRDFAVKDLRKNFNTYLSISLERREQQLAIRRANMIVSREKLKEKNGEYKIKIKDVFIGSIIQFNEPNNYDRRFGLVINKTNSSIKFIYFGRDKVKREVEEGMYEYYHINLNHYFERDILEDTKTMRCREEWEFLSREVVFYGNGHPYASLKEYLSFKIENESDLQKSNNVAEKHIMEFIKTYMIGDELY